MQIYIANIHKLMVLRPFQLGENHGLPTSLQPFKTLQVYKRSFVSHSFIIE